MNDIKFYQDLTFEVLDELIREKCKEGHSTLTISKYGMGEDMVKYLRNKGFTVIVGYYHIFISW